MDAGGGFYWEKITELMGLLWQGDQEDVDHPFSRWNPNQLEQSIEYQKIGAPETHL